MTAVGAALFGLGFAIMLAGRQHLLLHLFQLEHYEPARLRVWVARRGERFPRPELATAAAAIAVLVAAAALSPTAMAIAGAAGAVALAWRGRTVIDRDQVKPLAFTTRAKRTYAAALILSALLLAVPAVAASSGAGTAVALAIGAGGLVALLAAPEILIAATWLLKPVQRADNARFVRRARRRLAEVRPLVIGITGSYGKTTTKACVSRVADLAGPSYPTPASFNSYLGVVRAINEGLRPEHKSFVVEMGAYRRGDIAELCELAEPTIGILTAIGPAHLERFGNLDVTAAAKGELAQSLPAEGLYVTRADDERCRRSADGIAARVRLFAPAPHPDADIWAENVRIERGRTNFDLCVGGGGGTERQPVRARLLGTLNVANLLAAAAAGIELGPSPAQISRALSQVSAPEHRLAPIVNQRAGIVVIDDAYNANPTGAKAALEVLRDHAAQRRILITPGMVELGDREAEENRLFGAMAAGICDEIILVGPRQTEAIRAGLAEQGYPEARMHVAADGKDAQALLTSITRAGDVILFENDLPDLYQGGRDAPGAGPEASPAAGVSSPA